MRFEIRRLDESDRKWVRSLLEDHWGGTTIVSRGRAHRADRLPGFVAVRAGVPVGLLTFHIEGGQMEVVTLNSLEEHQGIGTALLEAAQAAARAARCRRLWLVTTNDNMPAIEFYRGRGLEVAAIHPGAVDVSRRIKPEIPERGIDGVPIQDEIELALSLEPAGPEPTPDGGPP